MVNYSEYVCRKSPTKPRQEVDELDGGDGGEGGGGNAFNRESAFKREFQRLDRGNGVVHIRDMPQLIQGALGRDARPWIKDRILKMFEPNRYRSAAGWTCRGRPQGGPQLKRRSGRNWMGAGDEEESRLVA